MLFSLLQFLGFCTQSLTPGLDHNTTLTHKSYNMYSRHCHRTELQSKKNSTAAQVTLLLAEGGWSVLARRSCSRRAISDMTSSPCWLFTPPVTADRFKVPAPTVLLFGSSWHITWSNTIKKSEWVRLDAPLDKFYTISETVLKATTCMCTCVQTTKNTCQPFLHAAT